MAQDRLSQTRMVTDGGAARILAHHVEMRVEGGDLEDLGLGQLQLRGECCKVARREVAVAVLDQVQILDQQIAPARHFPQEFLDFLDSVGLDLAPLGNGSSGPPAGTGMARGTMVVRHGLIHLDQQLRLRPHRSSLGQMTGPALRAST
jgi:hypothetical protein